MNKKIPPQNTHTPETTKNGHTHTPQHTHTHTHTHQKQQKTETHTHTHTPETKNGEKKATPCPPPPQKKKKKKKEERKTEEKAHTHTHTHKKGAERNPPVPFPFNAVQVPDVQSLRLHSHTIGTSHCSVGVFFYVRCRLHFSASRAHRDCRYRIPAYLCGSTEREQPSYSELECSTTTVSALWLFLRYPRFADKRLHSERMRDRNPVLFLLLLCFFPPYNEYCWLRRRSADDGCGLLALFTTPLLTVAPSPTALLRGTTACAEWKTCSESL